MAKVIQLPTKHRTKKVNEEQQKEIEHIQKTMQEQKKRPVTFLEAKHEYFEAEEKGTINLLLSSIGYKGSKAKPDAANQIVAAAEPEIKKATEKFRKERKTMTIQETKLGVTLVLSKEDCKILGFNMDRPTKEVIVEVRKRLKLAAKK